MVRPDHPIVCVSGDGAMQMAMMELAIAVKHRCGVTWIVLNNRSLGWPQFIQRLKGQPEVATNFETSPDFVKLARAQGCKGIALSDAERVDDALRAALRANRRGTPVLIDVAIARHDYPPHFVDFHHNVWGLGAKNA